MNHEMIAEAKRDIGVKTNTKDGLILVINIVENKSLVIEVVNQSMRIVQINTNHHTVDTMRKRIVTSLVTRGIKNTKAVVVNRRGSIGKKRNHGTIRNGSMQRKNRVQ